MAAERDDDRSVRAQPGVRACPICGKPTLPGFRPFCSKRCADIDLHRWLGGVYAVPDEASAVPGGDDHEEG
jgi:endogenous inhibitor of DNA gyrase (YacG/DUF329 family)